MGSQTELHISFYGLTLFLAPAQTLDMFPGSALSYNTKSCTSPLLTRTLSKTVPKYCIKVSTGGGGGGGGGMHKFTSTLFGCALNNGEYIRYELYMAHSM
jgi:hypothetical protein